METESGGIQNEFFNRARKDRVPLTVVLADGRELVGRVRAFDKFTILLETDSGEQIIFKHAIATVGASRAAGAAEARGGAA